MAEYYINSSTLPNLSSSKPLEVPKNDQSTPRRTSTIYQTTGVFKDISEKNEAPSTEDNAR